jgi:hypothetical protein
MTPANAPSDDLDQAMQDVLLAMTMLSYGSTSAWDSNGGTQGKPGSRILVLVDRPLSDVFRERWENANGPTSRRQILEEARRELDQWRGRADRERPETLTAQQEENLILEEGKGSWNAALTGRRPRRCLRARGWRSGISRRCWICRSRRFIGCSRNARYG